MKIRTTTNLSELIDSDFAWRLKEIHELKSMLNSASRSREATIMRSSIALAYAHWEGFVKNSTYWYIVFVNNQHLTYNDLKEEFSILGLKDELNTLISSKKSHINVEILRKILRERDKRVYMSLANAVDTESNLNSIVFENIARSVALDVTKYEVRFNFINEALLGRRNKIAHGENVELEKESLISMLNDVINLLSSYKNDIINSAAEKLYMRSAIQAAPR